MENSFKQENIEKQRILKEKLKNIDGNEPNIELDLDEINLLRSFVDDRSITSIEEPLWQSPSGEGYETYIEIFKLRNKYIEAITTYISSLDSEEDYKTRLEVNTYSHEEMLEKAIREHLPIPDEAIDIESLFTEKSKEPLSENPDDIWEEYDEMPGRTPKSEKGDKMYSRRNLGLKNSILEHLQKESEQLDKELKSMEYERDV